MRIPNSVVMKNNPTMLDWPKPMHIFTKLKKFCESTDLLQLCYYLLYFGRFGKAKLGYPNFGALLLPYAW